MKYIQIGIYLTDDLGIKKVVIDENNTHLPSDSELLKRVSKTILKSLGINEESVKVQDLLSELNIDVLP